MRAMQTESPAAPVIQQNLRWPSRFFIITLLVLALGLLIRPLVDPDVYIHLRDGKHWIATGLQPGNDPFTYTAEHKPIEKVEWLFRIGLYAAWKIGGYNFLIILKALGLTLALYLLGLLIYRRWPHLGITGGLLGLGALAAITLVFGERPFVFTYLLLPIILLLLDDYLRVDIANEPRAGKKLWLIPLLVIPWANFHPGFMVLFGFLAARIFEDTLTFLRTKDELAGQRLVRVSIIFGVSFLAGACNPLGFSIYTFVLKTVSSQAYMLSVREWLPPDFKHHYFFFSLLGLTWLFQLLSLRKTRYSDILLLIIFSYLAVKSRRNIPLFLIAALPPLAGHLQYVWKQWFPRLELSFVLRRISLAGGGLLVLVILVWTTSLGYAFRLGLYPDWHPDAALTWIKAHPVKGRLFTPFAWGGYITWTTQGKIKVFMDGRLPLYGDKVYQEYCKIFYGDSQDCLPLLNRYHIEVLIVSPKNHYKFFEQLDKSGEWALVYWDHVSQIYLHRNGPNQHLIDQFEYRAVDPNATPYFHPAQPEQALKEIRRAGQSAPDSYLPRFFEGDLMLHSGNPGSARPLLEQVLLRAPKHSHSYFDLGLIAFQENKLILAERYLRQAIRFNSESGFQAKTSHLLALSLKPRLGRRPEALRWARRAMKFQPSWKAAQDLVLELQTGY